MLQHQIVDSSWESSINATDINDTAKELKTVIEKKCHSAMYFVSDHLTKIEEQSSNLNSMLEDALLLMKLEKSKPTDIKQAFDLGRLKSELIIEFENFYPFKKFELEVGDTDVVELDKTLFTRGIKKFIQLAIQESGNLKPEVNIYASTIDISFKSLQLTEKEFSMVQEGQISDSEQGRIEAISMRVAVAKKMVELSGGAYSLRLNQKSELEVTINCDGQQEIEIKEVA